MDIRNWPMDRIMQLPDECFGQRWPIGVWVPTDSLVHGFQIATCAFPERFVIWELRIWSTCKETMHFSAQLFLGDHLPADLAEAAAMEQLLPCVGGSANLRSQFYGSYQQEVSLRNLRLGKEAAGRRLVVASFNGDTINQDIMVCLVVSSIPTEVPDWLCSGRV